MNTILARSRFFDLVNRTDSGEVFCKNTLDTFLLQSLCALGLVDSHGPGRCEFVFDPILVELTGDESVVSMEWAEFVDVVWTRLQPVRSVPLRGACRYPIRTRCVLPTSTTSTVLNEMIRLSELHNERHPANTLLGIRTLLEYVVLNDVCDVIKEVPTIRDIVLAKTHEYKIHPLTHSMMPLIDRVLAAFGPDVAPNAAPNAAPVVAPVVDPVVAPVVAPVVVAPVVAPVVVAPVVAPVVVAPNAAPNAAPVVVAPVVDPVVAPFKRKYIIAKIKKYLNTFTNTPDAQTRVSVIHKLMKFVYMDKVRWFITKYAGFRQEVVNAARECRTKLQYICMYERLDNIIVEFSNIQEPVPLSTESSQTDIHTHSDATIHAVCV